MSKKVKDADAQITYYDVADHKTRTAKASAISKYSTKDTVNLCIRERKGISYELFFLLVALFFTLLAIIEFFGVYRPYYNIEQAEKQLADDKAYLEQLQDDMSDFNSVRDQYRQYNYENFPRDTVNRDDVFDLIERVVFDRGRIISYSISDNRLDLTISDVSPEDFVSIPLDIGKDKIVESYDTPSAEVKQDNETGKATFRIIIYFKNATEVK